MKAGDPGLWRPWDFAWRPWDFAWRPGPPWLQSPQPPQAQVSLPRHTLGPRASSLQLQGPECKAALGKSSPPWPSLWECLGTGPWRAGPGVWDAAQRPARGHPASCLTEEEHASVKKVVGGVSDARSLGMLSVLALPVPACCLLFSDCKGGLGP